MEIRNNAAGSESIDLTKANRDAIRERNPLPAPAPKPAPTPDAGSLGQLYPKRVKLAREAHANEVSVQKRVEEARIRYESVHKRVREARERFHKGNVSDQVTLSKGVQDLAAPPADQAPTRAQEVQELKSQLQGGRLDADSLIAEAARRMLSAD